jgi:hypothetical protein
MVVPETAISGETLREGPLAMATILVGGSVAQRPGSGGHTWVFLQYLLGFRRLGHDVVLVDRLDPDMCRDASGQPCTPEDSENVRYLAAVMERFGLGERWAVLVDGGARSLGMSRAALDRAAGAAALILNVNGFVDDPGVMARPGLRAYLDIDPGFGQMWRALGLHDMFAGHDAYVTIGERIGAADCTVPACGLDWITTPQPILLDEWELRPPHPGGAFTSVASWRGPFAPIEFEGITYGLRVHEFRRFAALPQRAHERFEVALDIHEAETADLELLAQNGWRLADPAVVAGDPLAYREYVEGSKAELMVAKGMYVQSRSGWVSDRSICYLAGGRPVVAQETGFSELYPAGSGLLAFTDLDGAVAAVEAVAGDYERHCRAARALAEEHFDSDRVLRRLLEELGIR